MICKERSADEADSLIKVNLFFNIGITKNACVMGIEITIDSRESLNSCKRLLYDCSVWVGCSI